MEILDKLYTEMKTELKLLLARNLDGYEGYKYACEHIENENFKNFLKAYSAQRLKYANEIKKELEKRDISYRERTILLGEVHQSLIKLKNSISNMSDSALLKECIRGENQAIMDYEKVLKSNTLSADIQKMVLQHHVKIRAASNTLSELLPVV